MLLTLVLPFLVTKGSSVLEKKEIETQISKLSLATVKQFCSILFYLYTTMNADSKILVSIIAITEEIFKILSPRKQINGKPVPGVPSSVNGS